MPRYEFVEGTSKKFWEIELDGESFTVRFGRIGTDGQEQTKDFDTPADAKREYKKLVAEKTKKGYKLVSSGADAPAAVSARNPELEAAIERTIDSPQGYLVYGDWLQSQGDPRGELIAIQARLADLAPPSPKARPEGRYAARQGSPFAPAFPDPPSVPEAKPLLAAEKKLLSTHADALLGPLAPLMAEPDDEGTRIAWYCGFFRSLKLAMSYGQTEAGEVEFEDAILETLSHPSARFVRGLSIGMFNHDGDNHYPKLLKKIGKAGLPPTLRTLYVGDFEFPEQNEISWVSVGDASMLYAAAPQLETLILQGADIGLGKAVALPRLRTLVLKTGGLPKAAARAVAASTLPELERLVIWTGDENYGADSKLADVAPVLDGAGFPKLKHLGVMNCAYTDELVEALARSKLLRRLETLDLSMGTLTDGGAESMARSKDAFAHLQQLDVGECLLTPKGILALAGIAKHVSSDDQRADDIDGDHRYVAVGE